MNSLAPISTQSIPSAPLSTEEKNTALALIQNIVKNAIRLDQSIAQKMTARDPAILPLISNNIIRGQIWRQEMITQLNLPYFLRPFAERLEKLRTTRLHPDFLVSESLMAQQSQGIHHLVETLQMDAEFKNLAEQVMSSMPTQEEQDQAVAAIRETLRQALAIKGKDQEIIKRDLGFLKDLAGAFIHHAVYKAENLNSRDNLPCFLWSYTPDLQFLRDQRFLPPTPGSFVLEAKKTTDLVNKLLSDVNFRNIVEKAIRSLFPNNSVSQ